MPHKTTDTDDLDTGRTSRTTTTTATSTATTTSASTTATHQTNPTAVTTDDDNPTASAKSAISTSPPSSSTATHHRRPNTTTNHNNNNAPPKRTTIPLADGWTLVSTTKSQQHRNRKNNKKGMRGGGYSGLSPAGLRAAHEPAGPAKLMPGATKEWLMERLVKFRERWAECACRRGIEEVLERAGVVGAGVVESVEKAAGENGEGEEDKGGGGKRKIRNAVCIGLGSLSVDNIAAGVRSMWQLVCFLDIVGMLSESAAAGEEVKMYAEDPVFNTLDEEVFEELGITVVKGLRSTDGSRQEGAAQFIEPDSLIFAPFMPSFIMLEDFLAGKDPAIYIGNDVLAMLDLAKSQIRYSGDVDERTRRCIQAAEEFLAQGREVVALPEFDLHEHALAGQMIYWRKPTEES